MIGKDNEEVVVYIIQILKQKITLLVLGIVMKDFFQESH